MGYSTIIRAQSSRSSCLYYSGKSENIKQIARMVLVDDLNSLTTLLFNTVSGLGSIFILKKILKVYI
jgi:hypothetical protein